MAANRSATGVFADGALVVRPPLAHDAALAKSGRDSAAEHDRGDLKPWLAVTRGGRALVYSGKVDLGTGVKTALAQIVADELDLSLSDVEVVQGDTERTLDQGYTAGSRSIALGGAQLRKAAAAARSALLDMGAKELGVAKESVDAGGGFVFEAAHPSRRVAYGELLKGAVCSVAADDGIKVKDPAAYRVVGTPAPRKDIAEIVTGQFTYIQDVRMPGMLHGRVVRPPAAGAIALDVSIEHLDESSIARLAGAPKVVRIDNFVAVAADSEWAAIEAARQLKIKWKRNAALPAADGLATLLRSSAANLSTLKTAGDVEAGLRGAMTRLSARYQWPFQGHNSIGPSCAVADVKPGHATVWCASQGVYQCRAALAGLLGLAAEQVHVTFVPGAGCYGHNGADDAAADAALISQALGVPVRVQWSRSDEHGWNPKGPAMAFDLRGGVDGAGRVSAWEFHAFTPTHSTRPGPARNLLASSLANRTVPVGPELGGSRNAPVNYEFANSQCVMHWIPTERAMLRPSALRTLGATANSFANESFMDELAAAARRDPIEFRLSHLSDPREIEAIRAAARAARWEPRPSPAPHHAHQRLMTGRGVSFVRYENIGTVMAAVAEVEVDRETGHIRVHRVVIAHDCGLIVNPNGLRNQIEGNVLQGVSRALKEEVRFSADGVSSLDWDSYPILRFDDAPEVEVVLINRPHEPATGAGESALATVPAAIANALFDATGARVRTAPLTPQRVKAALAEL